MTFDPAIHHRRSHRLPGYNYAAHGAYFLTLCVQDKACLFGNIDNGNLTLSEAGRMVGVIWQEMPARHPNLTLDEHIVMPDHFHGIIVINAPSLPPLFPIHRRGEPCVRPNCGPNNHVKNKAEHMKTMGEHQVRPYSRGPNGTLDGSVGRVVQWFKTMATNAYIRGVCNQQWPPFRGRLWQRDYYDRIIRNQKELDHMRRYIRENPTRWNTNHPIHPL